MKIISSSSMLQREFARLMAQYDEFLWATAWAGIGSEAFKGLVGHSDKISRIVVGLHFFQTHPDFIAAFMTHKGVRFIKQTTGTFHPKVYLFRGGSYWELLVGSANFTTAAFATNTEATVLIESADANAPTILKAVRSIVDSGWNAGGVFTPSELEHYRHAFNKQREKTKSLSGQYGAQQAEPKPIFTIPVAMMTWQQFIKRVASDGHHDVKGRLGVIEKARELFATHEHFSGMSPDERKFIAGLPNHLETGGLEWAWFGNMRGDGRFAAAVSTNDSHLSSALDRIPLYGQLTRAHYDNFISEYRKALDGEHVATATRLLAMKRPDTFVCFDSRNRRALCDEFEISQSGMTYERYWNDIVARVFDSDWWNNTQPKNPREQRVSVARAAFLDSLYYIE